MVSDTLGDRPLVNFDDLSQSLFFNPTLVTQVGIDAFIKDAVFTPAQQMDAKVVNTLRNNLFGPPSAGRGEDLIARNMARSIEIGMCSYDEMRALYGIDDASWPKAPENQRQLAYIGVFSEPLVPGSSLPRTVAVSIMEQFRRIKRYDENWYDLPSSKERFGATYAPDVLGATLRNVVLRNTDLTPTDLGRQTNLFFVP